MWERLLSPKCSGGFAECAPHIWKEPYSQFYADLEILQMDEAQKERQILRKCH